MGTHNTDGVTAHSHRTATKNKNTFLTFSSTHCTQTQLTVHRVRVRASKGPEVRVTGEGAAAAVCLLVCLSRVERERNPHMRVEFDAPHMMQHAMMHDVDDGQTTLRNSYKLGRTHGLPTSHHSLTVLLGRVVILRSSEARVLRPIDGLTRRQNVTFSNL